MAGVLGGNLSKIIQSAQTLSQSKGCTKYLLNVSKVADQEQPLSLKQVRDAFKMRRSNGERFLQEMNTAIPNEGIIKTSMSFMPTLLLTMPNAFADVLVHHPYDFIKSETGRDVLRELLGNVLVVTEGGTFTNSSEKTLSPHFLLGISKNYIR
jgi:hypothetical protein